LELRKLALVETVRLYASFTTPPASTNVVRDSADLLYAWLAGSQLLTLIEGPVMSQSTGLPTGTTHQPGEIMQIHDDEKFTLTVDTKDAKGFETADTVAWTSDDNGAVVSLTVAADGRSCTVTAVAPGHVTITATDSAVTPALTVTEAVDVVTEATSAIALVEGPVTKQ
jgi:hypothetical protein